VALLRRGVLFLRVLLTITYSLRFVHLVFINIKVTPRLSPMTDPAPLTAAPLVFLAVPGVIGGKALVFLISPESHTILVTRASKQLFLLALILAGRLYKKFIVQAQKRVAGNLTIGKLIYLTEFSGNLLLFFQGLIPYSVVSTLMLSKLNQTTDVFLSFTKGIFLTLNQKTSEFFKMVCLILFVFLLIV